MAAATSPMMPPLPTTDQCHALYQHGEKVHIHNADNVCKTNGLQRPTNNRMATNSNFSARSTLSMAMITSWIEAIFYYLTGIGLIISALHIFAKAMYKPQPAHTGNNGIMQCHSTRPMPPTIPPNEPCCRQDIQQEQNNDEPPLIAETNSCNKPTPLPMQNSACQCQREIGAHHPTTPTNIDFIQHGRRIVEVEANKFGRKHLLWRIQYRNRDGLFLSLFLWYWTTSWVVAYLTYILTHGLSELALWQNIGHRCVETIGSEQVHPAVSVKTREVQNNAAHPSLDTTNEATNDTQHPSLVKKIQLQENCTPPNSQASINKPHKLMGTNRNAQTSPNYASQHREEVKCTKWHRLLASQILSANKGKRKTHDRPKRHQQWMATRHNNNAKHSSNKLARTNATSRKKIQLCHQSLLRKKETSTNLFTNTKNDQRRRYRLIPFASRKGRPPNRPKPTQKYKRPIATPIPWPAMTNEPHTEPSNLLRCTAKCLGMDVFWGNVFQHLIEGSGLVMPRRDVIKWFTY